MINRALVLSAAATVALVAGPASAAFVLANSNGGDGYVMLGPVPFHVTLVGSDNGADANVVTFSNVATAAHSFIVNYRYHTDDGHGSNFDRAGVFINGDFFQFSPPSSEQGFTLFGHFAHDVAIGDTFGLYIDSTNGILGRATLSIGGVPEPTSWALLITGFGIVGAAMRRRSVALVA